MEYNRIVYPDGQISAEIIGWGGENLIKERINSYTDLIFVKSIAEAAKYNNDASYNLFIPCLFGQRSDRRFRYNQSFDLKIIADIINSCNFSKVSILDPHSDVALALINNSEKISPFMYVSEAVKHITNGFTKSKLEDLVLISPDAGAYKKVFGFGTDLGLPVAAAVKHRDLKGNIDLQFIGKVKGKDCLIVDDLCDGGYTFTVLGKKLKELGARKVYLYITHGYFSKGFEVFNGLIDHIYCTNSVKDIELPVKLTIRVSSGMYTAPWHFLTQFKVI